MPPPRSPSRCDRHGKAPQLACDHGIPALSSRDLRPPIVSAPRVPLHPCVPASFRSCATPAPPAPLALPACSCPGRCWTPAAPAPCTLGERTGTHAPRFMRWYVTVLSSFQRVVCPLYKALPRPCRHSIHFMCKGMSQAEVAHMFSHGFVCFRSFRADTGACPSTLPLALATQPPVPEFCALRAQHCAKLIVELSMPLDGESPRASAGQVACPVLRYRTASILQPVGCHHTCTHTHIHTRELPLLSQRLPRRRPHPAARVPAAQHPHKVQRRLEER